MLLLLILVVMNKPKLKTYCWRREVPRTFPHDYTQTHVSLTNLQAFQLIRRPWLPPPFNGLVLSSSHTAFGPLSSMAAPDPALQRPCIPRSFMHAARPPLQFSSNSHSGACIHNGQEWRWFLPAAAASTAHSCCFHCCCCWFLEDRELCAALRPIAFGVRLLLLWISLNIHSM